MSLRGGCTSRRSNPLITRRLLRRKEQERSSQRHKNTMQSKAKDVTAYLKEVPEERRADRRDEGASTLAEHQRCDGGQGRHSLPESREDRFQGGGEYVEGHEGIRRSSVLKKQAAIVNEEG